MLWAEYSGASAAGAIATGATWVSASADDRRRLNLSASGTETGSGGISSARNGIASATTRIARHTLSRNADIFRAAKGQRAADDAGERERADRGVNEMAEETGRRVENIGDAHDFPSLR